MGTFSDYFKGVKDAKTPAKYRYLVPGDYEVEIDGINVIISQKPEDEGQAKTVYEMRVLSFDGVDYTDSKGEQRSTRGEYRKGDKVSHVVKLTGRYAMADTRQMCVPITAHLLAADGGGDVRDWLNKVEMSFDEDDAGRLCEPDQPGRGARLRIKVRNDIKTHRKTQQLYDWTTITEIAPVQPDAAASAA